MMKLLAKPPLLFLFILLGFGLRAPAADVNVYTETFGVNPFTSGPWVLENGNYGWNSSNPTFIRMYPSDSNRSSMVRELSGLKPETDYTLTVDTDFGGSDPRPAYVKLGVEITDIHNNPIAVITRNGLDDGPNYVQLSLNFNTGSQTAVRIRLTGTQNTWEPSVYFANLNVVEHGEVAGMIALEEPFDVDPASTGWIGEQGRFSWRNQEMLVIAPIEVSSVSERGIASRVLTGLEPNTEYRVMMTTDFYGDTDYVYPTVVLEVSGDVSGLLAQDTRTGGNGDELLSATFNTGSESVITLRIKSAANHWEPEAYFDDLVVVRTGTGTVTYDDFTTDPFAGNVWVPDQTGDAVWLSTSGVLKIKPRAHEDGQPSSEVGRAGVTRVITGLTPGQDYCVSISNVFGGSQLRPDYIQPMIEVTDPSGAVVLGSVMRYGGLGTEYLQAWFNTGEHRSVIVHLIGCENYWEPETVWDNFALRSKEGVIDGLIADIDASATYLSGTLIPSATTAGIETAYAVSACAMWDLWETFAVADRANPARFAQAYKDLLALKERLDLETASIEAQLSAGADPALAVPDPNLNTLTISGNEFVANGEPVMLVGPMGWVWGMHPYKEIFGELGFNTLRTGADYTGAYDATGTFTTLPWWAFNDIANAARADNMAWAMEISAHQNWLGLSRPEYSPSEEYTWDELLDVAVSRAEFRTGYQSILNQISSNYVGSKIAFGVVTVEGWRPIVKFTTTDYGADYAAWLADEYGTIGDYNSLNGTSFTDFSQVDFPTSSGTEPYGRRYDYAMYSARMIEDEVLWCKNQIRNTFGQQVVVGGYVTYGAMDQPSDFFANRYNPNPLRDSVTGAVRSEYTVCDFDHGGGYGDDDYRMSTVINSAMFRDMVGGLIPGVPQVDGELHFANRLIGYPEGWTRAWFFQSYIHGLSSSYAWVWQHNEGLDAELLFQAQLCSDMTLASLDLRRMAGTIAAFHDTVPTVAMLYSHASLPATGITAGEDHLSQLKTAYEGLFFTGLKMGFVSDEQIRAEGLASSPINVLIVPAATHVSDETVAAIETFAATSGKKVILIGAQQGVSGNCFKYDRRAGARNWVPDANFTCFPAFATAADARDSLESEVAAEQPPVLVTQPEEGKVEWRYAEDGTHRFLFLLNLGYDAAAISITDANGPVAGSDVITGERIAANTLIGSMETRVLLLD
ncbi:MAG: hypothetical protein Q7Q73_15360 [Verrucomicrobiota bacterium JB024]|nr:hypothetical protein [Verrucomicrobiota bacterium JB024]